MIGASGHTDDDGEDDEGGVLGVLDDGAEPDDGEGPDEAERPRDVITDDLCRHGDDTGEQDEGSQESGLDGAPRRAQR